MVTRNRNGPLRSFIGPEKEMGLNKAQRVEWKSLLHCRPPNKNRKEATKCTVASSSPPTIDGGASH